MRTPAEAFKAYYASMSDSDLLTVAKNRISYIRLVQDLLAQELERRRIATPAVAPAGTGETSSRQSRGSAGHLGATEEQVSMVATLPERTNNKGTKIEDIAGTGEHDSLGG